MQHVYHKNNFCLGIIDKELCFRLNWEIISVASGDFWFGRLKLWPQDRDNSCLLAVLFVTAERMPPLPTKFYLFLAQAASCQAGNVLEGSRGRQALGRMWRN